MTKHKKTRRKRNREKNNNETEKHFVNEPKLKVRTASKRKVYCTAKVAALKLNGRRTKNLFFLRCRLVTDYFNLQTQ